MSLSGNSVFEVRTAGDDTNGGGFVTGASGSDWSQQDAKRTGADVTDISVTDAVANGTATITSATANFATTIIGNIIYLQGGTGALAAGWYQVTARASATSITIDRNVATGTGITMNIGGALASLGMVGGVGFTTGTLIYIKTGTYTISSATPNISGGCFSSNLNFFYIEGYQTTRGDLGTPPLLQASGISTFKIIVTTAASLDSMIANINIDGAGLTSSRGIDVVGIVFNCNGFNFTNGAFRLVSSNLGIFVRCTGSGCSTVPCFNSGTFLDCVAYNNTVTGFSINSPADKAIRCISESNSGASSVGFDIGSGNRSGAAINCVSYNNGSDGFLLNSDQNIISNCIAESNVGFGINVNSQTCCILTNNATFSNTAGAIGNATGKGIISINPIVGLASFFTNAPNQDFSLNSLSSGGALARSAGYPGALPIGGTGYLDVGVLQHLGIPFFAMLGAQLIRGLR